MQESKYDYRRIAGLNVYIDRVGAEQLNFRRFMVKDRKGNYYVERTLIRLLPDGTIECSNAEHAPTKAEQEAIKEAFKEIEFPRAIGANKQQVEILQSKENIAGNNLFTLLNRHPKEGMGNVIMLQERRDLPSGAKIYVPWTFFSDGEWRMMEPEGLLPFWKPAQSLSNRIMVHEGAKVPRFLEAMLRLDHPAAKEWREKHPWAKELIEYEHWGIIGGALAPHRADYAELRKEKPAELVYVCDNDEPGEEVLAAFSRHYCGVMRGVSFDDKWPNSWDLADPMPEHTELYSPTGRWIGPTLKSMMYPATFATEKAPNPESPEKEMIVITRAFAREWLHSVSPEVFFHPLLKEKMSADDFNSLCRPFSHVRDTAALLRTVNPSKALGLKYDPTKKSGKYNSKEGGTYINTHVAPNVFEEPGDVSLFTSYINGLCPVEEDRNELLRWCATLVLHPDIKMHYGVLAVSETQGVGKSTLGEKILTPLLGDKNVSFPSEHEIVDSNFNDWAAHKRLAVAHEIYAGHSSKAYDKLKSIITDRNLSINVKYMPAYQIDNWLHIFACSNSPKALKLDSDDRRWLAPKISEKVQPRDFWIELNSWLKNENGLGKIQHWLRGFLKTHKAVLPGEHAPWTSVKRQIIQETMSDGQKLVQQVLETMVERANGKPVLVLDTALVQLIRDQLYEGRQTDRLEKPLTVRKVAKQLGFFAGEAQIKFAPWKAFNARLLSTDAELVGLSGPALAERGVTPLNPANYIGF